MAIIHTYRGGKKALFHTGHFRTQTKKIRDLGETELAPGGEARDGMYCFDFLIFGNIFMVYFQILTCNFIFFWLWVRPSDLARLPVNFLPRT